LGLIAPTCVETVVEYMRWFFFFISYPLIWAYNLIVSMLKSMWICHFTKTNVAEKKTTVVMFLS